MSHPIKPSNKFSVTCKKCGTPNLKWRLEQGDWRLYENLRVEHNRLKEHNCTAATFDDFEAV